jgi:nitroreductase
MGNIKINENIAKRWSPRAFQDRLVEKEKIAALFEAARWAPSSRNEQPWRFVYATKDEPENFEKILSTLVEGNYVWAKNAPLLMIGIAKENWDFNGKPNGHAVYDLGQSVANLSIQATNMGLHLHQMAGFSAEKAAEVLNIPEGYQPKVAIAVGYLGKPEQLPEKLAKREVEKSSRKPIAEIAFRGSFGE